MFLRFFRLSCRISMRDMLTAPSIPSTRTRDIRNIALHLEKLSINDLYKLNVCKFYMFIISPM